MSAPAGRREFFALEAGEYLERLSLLVLATDAPNTEDLVRYSRALRGAALMAAPPGYAVAAAAIEGATKAVREGALAWTPALVESLAATIEDCKFLLRRLREWSDSDFQRCDRIAQQLDALVGGTGRRRLGGSPPPSAAGELSSGVRAYVAREAAAVAATLEQLADSPQNVEPVLQRLQPLRGLGALPGLSPLPELLETLHLTFTVESHGVAWPADARRAFRAAAVALARMARDIAELGIPQHDSHEIGQAVQLLQEAFAGSGEVVAIESLFVAGDPDPLVQRGIPPVVPPGAGGVALELVGLSERLRHTAAQLRSGGSRLTRALQLQTLALTLRGLAMSREVRDAVGDALSRIDREIMSGRALDAGDPMAVLLIQVADIIGAASEGDAVAQLQSRLARLGAELDRIGRVPPAGFATVVPIEDLAPDAEADVVSIEALFFDPAPTAAPGYLPFEQTFATLFRLTHGEAAPSPTIVPIESLAPTPAEEVVSIESLLYRGRRALERADLVRKELDASLRTRRSVTGMETLLTELLDLVPLALDDDR